MRLPVFLSFFLLLSACASRRVPPPVIKKSPPGTVAPDSVSDKELRRHLRRKFPRDGKYTTMTDGAVTTERYRSLKGETILTLENEDLRTETEVLNSGRIITRTWQNGSVTTLTHAENGKSIMVVLDRNGEFGQKIITSKDSTGPWCFEYRKKRPVKLPPEECLGLIPGFD